MSDKREPDGRRGADGAQVPGEEQVVNASQGDKLANVLTMAGHLCCDLNQGALSAVLPFLVALRGFSYAEAAALVFAANIASALIQPLFGWLGDRRPRPWLMALGVLLAGAGMGGVGLFESYAAIAASVLVSGVGVAMFHPEGGRLSNLAAGQRKASGMSVFAVGGNIGFFAGPLVTAASVSALGLHGTAVLLIPAIACSALLLGFNKRFLALGGNGARAEAGKPGGACAAAPERWGMFALVMAALSARSVLSYGLLAFIPLFLMGELGQPEAASSLAISAFSIAGALATLASGRVTAKVDVRRLMAACFVATAALVVLLAMCRSVGAAVALAMLLAFAIDVFYPSAVALGMGYIPGHLGMASGLSYGVAVAVGGAAEPFFGMAGDAWGLASVFLLLAAVSLAGAALSAVLARAGSRRA